MEESLRSLLIADAGIIAVVGSRVTWGERPRGSALPSIVLHLIDGMPEYVMQGEAGLFRSMVQADCWAKTYAEAKSAARATKAVLSGYSGEFNGIVFRGIFVESERDLSDDGTESDDQLFRISIDLQLYYGVI